METEKLAKNKLITGTGKRKNAVARVFLFEKKGDIKVNDKPVEDILKTEKQELAWKKPFHIIGVAHPASQFSATIKVHGSGVASQLSAIVHGISRALAKLSVENAQMLRRAGLLTRDSRMVERKKPYLRKARKAPQYSKR